jgi:hypothetical protein
MSAFHPGIGDPLSETGNPYADGRPNWRLQSKIRNAGPPSYISSDFSVQAHITPPYASQLPELYRVNQAAKDDVKMIGRRHFDQHLRKTETEIAERGIIVPEHLVSGYDRPYGLGGKAKVDIMTKPNPKPDGGVWAPVQRQYPKVEAVEHGQGCRIVQKPVPNNPIITLRYLLIP